MVKDGGPFTGLHTAFSHTQLAVYVTSLFALCCIGYDSTHVGLAARGWPGAPKPWPPPPPATVAAAPACVAAAAAPPALPVLPPPAGHHPAVAHQQEVVLPVWCVWPWSQAQLGQAGVPRRRRAACGKPAAARPALAGPQPPAARGRRPPSRAGATCLFAYLYLRPLIRRGLGSASRGYINYSAVYICWLLMAVFYHLPSLESMGARG